MLYFNSKQIPELAGLNFRQRMAVVRAAADRLPAPTKLMLNIVKLLILSLMFLQIARAEGVLIFGYSALLLIIYPLITRPITFALCQERLAMVRRQLYPDVSE
ncbi:hypothetical protein GCM10010919_17050 [Alishewanella longhuensis]|uniref:Uncharacterized protein n=1 Tax=Alishewanella longhuensis TaxID=1091037 RepID=A0ABQ3KYR7_9ALTE|nr:DUF6170 family protein [Alishewanella longhuensis]GHG67967.1 hypothetical protein GCM10010919_17050 [Alishewanella longhuensis]